MEPSVLNHPRIAEIIDTLVAAGGGRVTYDTGGGGREMLIAAGAQLAAETRAPLTIVEARVLHSETRAFVRELQPDIRCAVISAAEAALQPAGSINGVLAVHADVLRDVDVRRPLLAMAHSADHLIVARHDYSDTTLDALATPGLVVRLRDLTPPAHRPDPIAVRWTSPGMDERKLRFVGQLNAPSEQDVANFEGWAEAMQNVDPDEVRSRLAQMQEKYAALRELMRQQPPAPCLRDAREHGQGQSAAHQQQDTQRPGLTWQLQ
ncbi:hypothetical protein ACNPQN_32795 [Streptomyces sp. NPDC056297]|uniref:hypothetical protein n=1 Tax=unclassified Streptomyces TaxID=2593676 RepID=UPI0035DA86F2